MKITIKENKKMAVWVGEHFKTNLGLGDTVIIVVQNGINSYGVVDSMSKYHCIGDAKELLEWLNKHQARVMVGQNKYESGIIGYLEDDKPMPTNKDELKTGDMFIHIGTGTVMEYLNGTFSLIGHTPSGNIVITTTQNFMETIGNYRRFHGTITIRAE